MVDGSGRKVFIGRMTVDLLISQLTDPFRIGLLVAMVYTARNTAAQAGQVAPVIFGLIFVAVLIPMTLGAGGIDKTTAMIVGPLSNAVIAAVIWGIWEIVARARRR